MPTADTGCRCRRRSPDRRALRIAPATRETADLRDPERSMPLCSVPARRLAGQDDCLPSAAHTTAATMTRDLGHALKGVRGIRVVSGAVLQIAPRFARLDRRDQRDEENDAAIDHDDVSNSARGLRDGLASPGSPDGRTVSALVRFLRPAPWTRTGPANRDRPSRAGLCRLDTNIRGDRPRRLD